RVGRRVGPASRRRGRGVALHPPRPSVPGRRRPAHELPSPPLDAPRARRRVRGLGDRASGVRRGGALRLPLLQLRRRDPPHVSPRFGFELLVRDPTGARLGRMTTSHGVVETPAFMPVGTHGAVKGMTPRELGELGATILLANAYHLAQRPGIETVSALGGLHTLMGWDGPILTDSGGFQARRPGAPLRAPGARGHEPA